MVCEQEKPKAYNIVMRYEKPCLKEKWGHAFLMDDKYEHVAIDGLKMTAKNIWEYDGDREELLEKLVGCCKPFSDSWLIDWDNDCADDVWTLRLVLAPNDETRQKIIECGYEVLKLEESRDELDPDVKFVLDFKEHQGYVDGYFPKRSIDDVEVSIARECALR